MKWIKKLSGDQWRSSIIYFSNYFFWTAAFRETVLLALAYFCRSFLKRKETVSVCWINIYSRIITRGHNKVFTLRRAYLLIFVLFLHPSPPSQWLLRVPLVIMLPQVMQGFVLPYGCKDRVEKTGKFKKGNNFFPPLILSVLESAIVSAQTPPPHVWGRFFFF